MLIRLDSWRGTRVQDLGSANQWKSRNISCVQDRESKEAPKIIWQYITTTITTTSLLPYMSFVQLEHISWKPKTCTDKNTELYTKSYM